MRPGIDLTRTFSAAPSRIFAAWTDGALLARWFGLPDATVAAECAARVGGAWWLTMEGANGATRFSGEYVAVDDPSHLAYTLRVEGAPGTETCTVDIAPHGDGCSMRFTQDGGNLTVEQYEQASAGYAVFLERLDALTRAT